MESSFPGTFWTTSSGRMSSMQSSTDYQDHRGPAVHACPGNDRNLLRTVARLPCGNRASHRPAPPHDESHPARRCDVSGSIIRTIRETTHSATQELIAAARFLHQAPYVLLNRIWIASRIGLRRVFPDTDFAMEVELLQNLNHRLTRSAVRCAQAPLGYICFSALKP